MHRFFAPSNQINGGSLILGPEETRHLRDVLRLKAADRVNVFDGEGREYLAEIAHVSKNSDCVESNRRDTAKIAGIAARSNSRRSNLER